MRFSILFWVGAALFASVAYAAFSGSSDARKAIAAPADAVALYPSDLPAAPPAPALPDPPESMAEAARVDAPEASEGAAAGSAPPLPAAPQAVDLSLADGPSSQAPAPLVVPAELRTQTDGGNLQKPEAWLVIVSSSPKADRDKVEADRARLKKRGVNLEIMDTDAYPRLKGGMWTLALGPYDTSAEANAAAEGIKSKVKETMVRRGL